MNERMRALRKESGLSQAKTAEKVGVSVVAYQNYEYGKRDVPSDVLASLSMLFGVSSDYILGLSDRRNNPRVMLPGFISSREEATVSIPLRVRVHAGPATEPEDVSETGIMVDIPKRLLELDPDCYAAVLEGDCMDEVCAEGCVVVISPNTPPQNGSIAVVSIDGHDAVIRRMYRTNDTLILSPESHNPVHKDIVITLDSDHTVEYGGTMKWFQARRIMD